MAHGLRHRKFEVTSEMMEAGVMLLLYPFQGELHTVFIKRTENKHDKHKGQISFPGGKVDSSDTSIDATALRELEEEIGVPPTHIQIIGQLSPLVIPVSNFLVKPVIGFIESRPQFIPEVSEVAEIIEAPIHIFKNIETPQLIDIPLGNKMKFKNVPYFDINGHVVWGATAMILAEFSEIAFRS